MMTVQAIYEAVTEQAEKKMQKCDVVTTETEKM